IVPMLILLAAVCTPAAAQSGSGVAAIMGTVNDPDNSPIPTAIVLIVNSATGYERVIYADGRGRYFASAVPVGAYTVQASAQNFTTVQQENVRVTVGATETINFTLKIGKISETVTVTAR